MSPATTPAPLFDHEAEAREKAFAAIRPLIGTAAAPDFLSRRVERQPYKEISRGMKDLANWAVSVEPLEGSAGAGRMIGLARISLAHDGSEAVKRQAEMLYEYARRHGLAFDPLRDLYVDEASGSKDTAARPELDVAKDAGNIAKRGYTHLVAQAVDRLYRNQARFHTLREELVEARGLRVITLDDNYDSGSENASNVVVGVQAAVAEEYSRVLSKKISAQKAQYRLAGRFLGFVPPWGWAISEGTHERPRKHLILDHVTTHAVVPAGEAEAVTWTRPQILRHLVALLLRGRSQMDLVRWLNDNHVPSAHDKLWTQSSVKQMLCEPVGSIHLTGRLSTQEATGKSRQRPDSRFGTRQVAAFRKVIDPTMVTAADGTPITPHEPLLTDAEFAELQSALRRRRRGRVGAGKALLTGTLKCGAAANDAARSADGLCGKSMYRTESGSYVCQNTERHNANDGGRREANSIVAAPLETMVVGALLAMMSDEAKAHSHRERQRRASARAGMDSAVLETQAAEARHELEQLEDSLAKRMIKISTYNELHVELTKTLAELEAQLRDDTPADQFEDVALSKLSGGGNEFAWAELDLAEQQEALRKMFHRVVVAGRDRNSARVFDATRVRLDWVMVPAELRDRAGEKFAAAWNAALDAQKQADAAGDCPECGTAFRSATWLAKHRTREHGVASGTADERPCRVCDRTFAVLSTLRRHERVSHGLGEGNPCSEPGCGLEFVTPARLSQHADLAHGGPESSSEGATCSVCGRLFKNGHGLNIHRNRVHGLQTERLDEGIPCPEVGCATRVTSKQGLSVHMGMAHPLAA